MPIGSMTRKFGSMLVYKMAESIDKAKDILKRCNGPMDIERSMEDSDIEDFIKEIIHNLILITIFRDTKLSEDFIRGYIVGAKCMKGIEIPSHRWAEIIKSVIE